MSALITDQCWFNIRCSEPIKFISHSCEICTWFEFFKRWWIYFRRCRLHAHLWVTWTEARLFASTCQMWVTGDGIKISLIIHTIHKLIYFSLNVFATTKLFCFLYFSFPTLFSVFFFLFYFIKLTSYKFEVQYWSEGEGGVVRGREGKGRGLGWNWVMDSMGRLTVTHTQRERKGFYFWFLGLSISVNLSIGRTFVRVSFEQTPTPTYNSYTIVYIQLHTYSK